MGLSPALLEIFQSGPSTLGETVRQLAAPHSTALQEALAREPEQIAVNGAAIERQTKPHAQFVRCKVVFLRECSQNFVFCHFI